MSLSSLIVQREIATIRAVEEALARQVLYGGDLVTNLLEVTALDESRLNAVTAEDLGLVPGPPGILPPPADDVARRTLPVELAARRSIYPLQMSPDGAQLVVAVAEPFSPEEEEQLMFALGVPIVQRIVPLVRIRQALAREFDVPLERRYDRLSMRLSGERITSSSRPPMFNEAPGAVLPPSPDLPAKPGYLSSWPIKEAPPPRRVTSTGFLAVRDDGLPAVPGTIVPHRIVSISSPPEQSSQAPTSAEPDTDPTPTPTDVDHLPPVIEKATTRDPRSAAGANAAARASVLRNIGAGEPKAARRRLRPLSFAEARKELDDVTDRDGILDLFFDFGRQFFDYSALFIVHGDIAEGRDAYGNGASREQVVGIGVPLDLPSLLSKSRNAKGPVVEMPSREGLDAGMIGDLHRSARADVAVIPVIVRTRAVAMLYGDAGDAAVTRESISDVATFAALAGQAFEKLILKKKLGGFTGGSSSASEGRVSGNVAAQMAPKSSARISNRPAPQDQAALTRAISERPVPIPKRPSDRAERAEALGRALFTNATVSVSAGSPPAGNVAAGSPKAASITPEEIANQEREHAAAGALMEFSVPRKRPHTPTYNSGAPAEMISTDESTPTFALTTLPRPSGRPAIPREDPIDPTLRPPERVFAAEPSPQTSSGLVSEDEARSIFDEIAEEHFLDDSGYPMSEQQVSLPPHLPPSSHNRAEPLPSVIVEVSAEVTELIDRYLNDPRDEQAQAGLVRLGEQAMPAIMARFPGPITHEARLEEDEPLAVSSCGPVLRLIAAQRRIALPFVVPHLNVTDEVERFWATYLITELPYVEAIAGLLPRLHDPVDRIRRAGRLAIRAIDRAHGEVVARELGKIVRDDDAERQRRALMIEVLEDLREQFAVPALVAALTADSEDLAQRARQALMTLTRQDFGSDPQRWASWWAKNAIRHRIEWLIDSLVHEQPSIRNAAGEELKAITKEYFGYYDDLPRRERDKAQQRYRDWWITTGRARFAAT